MSRKNKPEKVAGKAAASKRTAAKPGEPQPLTQPPANPPAATPPAPSAAEAALKLRQLELQVQEAELKLGKLKQGARQELEEAELNLRQSRATARKAEIDLANAEREASRANAEAAEACTFSFYDEVNWETTRTAIAELGKISRRFPGQPLTLILNSPGGSVIAGLALYDHIQDLRRRGHHVTVKCRGMAASMGGILLQSGDTRVVGPEAMILIHEVSSGTAGKVNEMQDRIDFSKRLWDKLARILAARSTMSAKQIKDKAFKYDWWLSAKEAVKLGFADEIG